MNSFYCPLLFFFVTIIYFKRCTGGVFQLKKNEDIEEIPLEFDNQAIELEPNYSNSTDKDETDDSVKQTMEFIDVDKLYDKNELDKYNIVINESTSIRKSNELSTAKLIQGLTLSQTQLFSFAIYQTQKMALLLLLSQHLRSCLI